MVMVLLPVTLCSDGAAGAAEGSNCERNWSSHGQNGGNDGTDTNGASHLRTLGFGFRARTTFEIWKTATKTSKRKS